MKLFRKSSIFLFCFAMFFQLSIANYFVSANEVDTEQMSDEQYKTWKESIAPNNEQETFDAYNTRAGQMTNEFIEVQVGTNGLFTMGTTSGDPTNPNDNNKNLLFGHNSGAPWSSETLIKVDNIERVFNATSVVYDSSNKIYTATDTVNGVEVKQIIAFEENAYTGRRDHVSIKYIFTNKTDISKDIGARIMLDTELGTNDGAPFRVPGVGNVTKELELSGSAIPEYWQAFDNLQNPSIISTGAFYKSISERPDKVQFAYWSTIKNSSFNYTINENTVVTGDSAVGVYYNPIAIAPNATRTIVTYYGLGDLSSVENVPPLYISVTAPRQLAVTEEDNEYYPNPFYVTAYVKNINPLNAPMTNVKVEIEFPPDSPLRLDNIQDELEKTIENMNQNEEVTLNWIVRATPQLSEALTTEYKIRAKADNVPEKIINLKLDLEKVEPSSQRILQFNNGEGASSTDSITVEHGASITRPTEPTKSGYKFEGWYASSDFLGAPWFGNLPERKLFLNLTLHAKWKQVNTSFNPQATDYYSFSNSSSSFQNDKYHINDEYYKILTRGLRSSQIRAINNYRNNKWEGSCQGMGMTMAMFYDGRLDTNFFQSNANFVSNITEPINSVISESMINYYQLIQFHPGFRNASTDSNSTTNAKLEKIISLLQSEDMWVEISIGGYSDKDGEESWGHLVMGHTLEDATYNNTDCYKVSLLESNSKGESFLYISKNYEKAWFVSDWNSNELVTGSNSDNTKKLDINAIRVMSQTNAFYTTTNLQNALAGQASAFSNNINILAEERAYLSVNYNRFKIIADNGDSVIAEQGEFIQDGENISDIDIYKTHVYDDGTTEYSISSINSFIIEPLSDKDSYKTAVNFDNSYMTATTTAKTKIKATSTPTIEVVDVENPTDIKLSLSYDDINADWINIDVSANTDSLKLQTIDGNYVISTETELNGKISVIGSDISNNEFTTEFATDSKELTVKANDDGDFAVFDGTDEQLGKEEITYTVIFATGGGSIVESATRVSLNSKITKPTDPTKYGYKFDDWLYNGVPWDFEIQGVTNNMSLEAKWIPVDTYDITFMADNIQVSVITLYEGEDLQQSDFPIVPIKSGYSGTWDKTIITNISDNITVTAIYIPDATIQPPIATPIGGTYTNPVTVTLRSEPGSTIYYTIDGTTPTITSNIYTNPITIRTTTTLKAITIVDNKQSTVIQTHYIITTGSTGDTGNTSGSGSSQNTGSGKGTGGTLADVQSQSSKSTTPPTTVNINEPEIPTSGIPTTPETTRQSFTDVSADHWAYKFVQYLADKKIMVGDGDGKFDPSRPLTRAEFAMVIKNGFDLKQEGTPKEFTDVAQGLWYTDAIGILSSAKIINGDPEGTFRPNDTITREEMAIVMNNLIKARNYDLMQVRSGEFEDLSQCSAFGKQSIITLYNLGILNGMDEQSFAPAKTLTRAETTSVVYNLIMKIEKET